MAAHFWVLVFYSTLTCDQARGPSILLFSLGHEGGKDTWYIYFTHRLSVVPNLDFCLIGRKTKDSSESCTDWLQVTYLTSGAIR